MYFYFDFHPFVIESTSSYNGYMTIFIKSDLYGNLRYNYEALDSGKNVHDHACIISSIYCTLTAVDPVNFDILVWPNRCVLFNADSITITNLTYSETEVGHAYTAIDLTLDTSETFHRLQHTDPAVSFGVLFYGLTDRESFTTTAGYRLSHINAVI